METRLDRLADRPLVKGIRRVLHVMPDELSQAATFRANIDRAKNPKKKNPRKTKNQQKIL